MNLRCLVLIATAGLFGCGGGDNLAIDGGGDATTNEGGGGDSGGKDGSPTDGGGGDGATDGGNPGDGGGTDGGGGDGGATFACGTKTCNSTTDYCEEVKAGVLDAGAKDGGVTVDSCLAYPVSCTADGGKPSCSCIVTTNCTCKQSGSDITVTCP